MNLIRSFFEIAQSAPDRIALWSPGQPSVTFAELRRMAASAQQLCRDAGVGPGDPVLMMDRPGPRLYAALLGTIANGSHALLLEPWVSIGRVDSLLQSLHPKAFFASTLAKVLAVRVPSLRQIPHKINPREIHSDLRGSALDLAEVPTSSAALITFTSSTDSPARAIHRDHGPLGMQLQALAALAQAAPTDGPDLCLYSNRAMANLMIGRTCLVFPHRWTRRALHWLAHLPPALSPTSVTCSPAFIRALLDHAPLPSLRSIEIARAVMDCALLEEGLKKWPDARWTYSYGSSESEPVARIDARESLRLSRAESFMQMLAFGPTLPSVQARFGKDEFAVKSPHLDGGAQWHSTGDRMEQRPGGLWYMGRLSVSREDFILEQEIYRKLGHTHCFLHRASSGELHLLGEDLKDRKAEIQAAFPKVASVIPCRIHRDKRHGTWINRRKTLRAAAPELVSEEKPGG